MSLPSADEALSDLALEFVEVRNEDEDVRIFCPNDEAEAVVGQIVGQIVDGDDVGQRNDLVPAL